MEQLIAELTHLAEEICEADVALNDGELMLIALNGLDASYDAFVMAQTARADEISFASFQGLLQAHEVRNLHLPTAIVIPLANVATKEDIICQICQKKGHTAISCYNRHNENRFPTVIDKRTRHHPRSSNFGIRTTYWANTIWYPDSGATDHVTANISDIQTRDPSPSASVILTANGNRVPILNSGNSSLSIGQSRLQLDNVLHVPEIKKILISV